MDLNLTGKLRLFSKQEGSRLLKGGNFGLELESQRVTADGKLALTPHPSVFGDKSEHPTITTDFSESQIEMITPTFQSPEDVYESLKSIRREVEEGAGSELLWPLSMPPGLPTEERIPIAHFQDTKEGRAKEVYRNGLALRYGKKMQMISGIHYNFSFGDEMVEFLFTRFGNGKDLRTFTDELYFALTRNFLRYRWLLIYLFGASPACDPTYDPVILKELAVVRQCCPFCRDHIGDYMRYATSLRVSRFGYSNAVQGKFKLFYNSLGEYTEKLEKMISTASREYLKLGVHENGIWKQLNGNILQKESEFYSSIRLKQNTAGGETQISALKNRGVKYVEVRILDIDPFEPLGISLRQLRFMQVFLTFCALEQSSRISARELSNINSNHHLTALFGRKPDLLLSDSSGKRIPLRVFGERIFGKLMAVAKLMDQDAGRDVYLRCVEQEQRKLSDAALLPSSRIVKEMRENQESYRNFGIRRVIENQSLKKPDLDLQISPGLLKKGVFENEYDSLQGA